ncbi:MAG: hypothetical protein ACLS43_09990 [Evtepia gabavorous]
MPSLHPGGKWGEEEGTIFGRGGARGRRGVEADLGEALNQQQAAAVQAADGRCSCWLCRAAGKPRCSSTAWAI